jgi:rod shape-determining protein MreD
VRRLALAAFLLWVVLIQVTWAPRFTLAGAFPNLALVAVVVISWTAGARAGMAWACVAGVMLDLTAAGPLGLHALALVAGAYATGFWNRNFDHQSLLHPAVAAAVSTLLYSLILLGADGTLALPASPAGIAVQLVVAACAYSAVLAPLAVVSIRRLRSLAAPPAGAV